MPIYEFECGSCGKRSDHLMRLSDPDPAACPECGAATLKRVLSAPQFRLAGAGWYETDFKGDKDRKRNIAGDTAEAPAKAADKPAEKPSEKASEKTADTKPSTKTETSTPASTPVAATAKPAA